MKPQLALVILAGVLAIARVDAQADAMRNADVTRMVAAGLSPDLVVQAIGAAPSVAFDLSTDGLIALKAANVTEAVISVMLKKGASAPSRPAPGARNASREADPPPAAEQVELPDGTEIRLRLQQSAVSSATAKQGDSLRFTVLEDVRVNNATLIAKGAPATGRVTEVRKAGSFGRGGALNFAIDSVTAVDGTRIPIRYTREEKGDSNRAGVMSIAVEGATGDAKRAISTAKGKALEKGAEVSLRSGTEYGVFSNGVHRVGATPGAPGGSRTRRR